MKNTLFLICPDSHMEPMIDRRYAGNNYFLTALAAVFDLSDSSTAYSLVSFLKYASIREICIVNDTSSRFINSVIQREKGYNTKSEEVIRELFIDHFYDIESMTNHEKKSQRLSALNVKAQARKLMEHDVLKSCLHDKNIAVRGLLYHRKNSAFEEVPVQAYRENLVYAARKIS